MVADLAERSLDRVAVVQGGQEEGRGRKRGGAVNTRKQGAATMVKVTELMIAKGGRSARRSVLFYVLAMGNGISGHYDCSSVGGGRSYQVLCFMKSLSRAPSPHTFLAYCNQGVSGKILGLKDFYG